MKNLTPCQGCLVINNKHPHIVIKRENSINPPEILIKSHKTNELKWVPVDTVHCGFRKGMEVKHIPFSLVLPSLGHGTVHQARAIGGKEQVLVEFPSTNRLHWLPYETLKWEPGTATLFRSGNFEDQAQHFKLKCLAHAIELWNENTGSLSHFELDPLPHQIHLVYQILASGDLNWLIADDVGLGKTIEVGLLLSALKQRKQLNRVLIVTPAGLTRQWVEEMKNRFHICDFRIYGEHFQIQSAEDWRRFPWIIASLDKLKQDKGLYDISLSDGWDLIIFDEAHRLTRKEFGKKYESSQRFRLAATLRHKCDSMLLLTATPHQGKQDQFRALLELLRPQWKKIFRTLDANPEILRHFVIRNDKSDVTDAEGNFIFKGKTVKTYTVPEDPKAKDFDKQLRTYFKKGYSAGDQLGVKGRAIGFVMTIYRKLASSSTAAIHSALTRRLEKLLSNKHETKQIHIVDDIRFTGEKEELLDTDSAEFFHGEREDLRDLIEISKTLLKNDLKLNVFLDELLPTLQAEKPNEKILIFTEYRTTQTYLLAKLESRFGKGKCVLIHGSMNYKEREESIANFEDDALFMISTEAGGEGINLQRQCHIEINYDLPWNPSRLLQRIGRLYRYGQKEIVLVLNIKSHNSFDEQLVGTLYDKIDQMIQDMQSVGNEFKEGWAEEVLGDFIYTGDLESVLSESISTSITRTEERISAALEKARKSAERQKDIFSFATSYDPNAMQHEIKMGTEQVRIFAEMMFPLLGIKVLERRRKGQVLTIQIPDELVDKGLLRPRMDITFHRTFSIGRSTIHMVDLESPLLQTMLKEAKSYNFGGMAVGANGINSKAIASSVLRWQNSCGRRTRQEFCIIAIDKNGMSTINTPAIRKWLELPGSSYKTKINQEETSKLYSQFQSKFEERIGEVSTENLHPEGIQWIASAWLNKQT